MFKDLLQKYTPQVFNEGLFTEQLFNKFYGSVNTRCFGNSNPYVSLVPFGDLFNHLDYNFCNYHMVNTKFHLGRENEKCHKSYYKNEKFLNDYSGIFSKEIQEKYETEIKGKKFNREHFYIYYERMMPDFILKRI